MALNLSLPALKIESSKLIPSLRLELNFDIKTSPSFTRIPIRAIIPNNEITFIGNPCNKWPHATVVKLNGIRRSNKNGWLYVLNTKPIVEKIRNKAKGKTTFEDSIVLLASLYWPSNETLIEGYFSFNGGIIVLVEHDVRNNTQRKIVDLKHFVYDLIINQIKTYSTYMKSFYSNYKSLEQWNNLFSKFSLIRYNRIKNSDDWTYFAIYEKK